MADTSFDFAGFKRAFVDQNVPAWVAFFAVDGQWIEYKHTHPPRSPRVMSGRREIEEFLDRVKASNVSLEIGDEVIGPDRAAFRVWCTLADGKRIIEHVIIHYSHGKITRQVDVEAWD
jgi:SnoaL-like domain